MFSQLPLIALAQLSLKLHWTIGQLYLKILRLVSLPQVSYPTHQVEGAISHRDQGIFAEQQGFRPVGWLGEFGKNNSGHTRLKTI